MESKLKALKVADLKEILKKASVSASPKGTKAELIAKIIAEPAAVDVYNMLHNPAGAALHQDAPSKPKSTNRPVSPSKAEEPAPAPHPTSTVTSTTTPADGTTVEDSELEKHKARAARFGIPLVEPKSMDKNLKKHQQPPENEGKLKARADRFGIDASAESKKQPVRKRGAPEEPTDPEELERRKKRAERFGLPLAGASKA